MSKTKILYIVGVLVLVGVGGYFALQAPKDSALNNDANSENLAGGTMPVGTEGEWNDTPMGNTPPDGKKMAFGQLVAQGGSYECTVNQYVGETVSQGTVYTSGTLVRGEFNSKANGLDINTSLIVRDGYTYTWTSMAPKMGFKAKVAANSEVNPNQETSGTISWNADQIGDYDCKDWTPDLTKFDLPAGVAFQELK